MRPCSRARLTSLLQWVCDSSPTPVTSVRSRRRAKGSSTSFMVDFSAPDLDGVVLDDVRREHGQGRQRREGVVPSACSAAPRSGDGRSMASSMTLTSASDVLVVGDEDVGRLAGPAVDEAVGIDQPQLASGKRGLAESSSSPRTYSRMACHQALPAAGRAAG